jgi:DNA-binding CsgD family transcriptional regulator
MPDRLDCVLAALYEEQCLLDRAVVIVGKLSRQGKVRLQKVTRRARVQRELILQEQLDLGILREVRSDPAAFSASERRVMELLIMENMLPANVATQLGISINSVRSYACNVRRKLGLIGAEGAAARERLTRSAHCSYTI